ncbi:uncharacterized protein ACA1_386460 [Acanthamoeba castellanii str. Neff]|uniref:Uncharacterized protein n=1 Tax=Acanthamoeba castellanii (strain ATCC 30010 / Neff) TaxID=1257118 RepID=L8H9B3_ACACF|nr:uncharacterized protein ACA1_386460 [Acanthamoeba castellanii str. Neff]ELR21837.1 hypothetical protein ACA1_386460 [Acanthamoeba castellanii str. Neff]
MDVTFKVRMPNKEQLHTAYCAYFCNCPKMRPHMDLKAHTFNFSCMPEDILNKSKQFVMLICKSRSQASCTTIEGMLNHTLNHKCIIEVVTNCLCEAKEFKAKARSDLESTRSDPSNAIIALNNILASN